MTFSDTTTYIHFFLCCLSFGWAPELSRLLPSCLLPKVCGMSIATACISLDPSSMRHIPSEQVIDPQQRCLNPKIPYTKILQFQWKIRNPFPMKQSYKAKHPVVGTCGGTILMLTERVGIATVEVPKSRWKSPCPVSWVLPFPSLSSRMDFMDYIHE